MKPLVNTEVDREKYWNWCRAYRRPLVVVTLDDRRFVDVELDMDTTGLGSCRSRDENTDLWYIQQIEGLFATHVPAQRPYWEYDDKGSGAWTVGDWPASSWIPRRRAVTVALQLLRFGLKWAREYYPEIAVNNFGRLSPIGDLQAL